MGSPASPRRFAALLLPAVLMAALGSPATAEDGYELWLRYSVLPTEARAAAQKAVTGLVVEGSSPTAVAIRAELQRGLSGLLGRTVPEAKAPSAAGALVVGTKSSPVVGKLGWTDALARLGDEGYLIRRATVGGHAVTVIASSGEAGALYGAFHFLRLLQTGQRIDGLDVAERPRTKRRLLNHWDNLDGTIERGYAGHSLWKWEELPGKVDARVVDYARANASLGINGTVVNSVNANPLSLRADYLAKTKALADAFRPYGLRVYMSANFAAPKTLGGLDTADPLDPKVAAWWKDKADEIYRLIPDFGGFLVKANSEGQPGPQDYKRTHADGANVLADAVKPHGGVVMWRAFVYDASVDPDRVKRAYLEFVPLEGKFRSNVFAQVKNGPLDFMPREPFHPLFGALPKTPIMAELQITQEYLGWSNHLVYLGTMWQEFLGSDTQVKGPGSTVAKVVDGSLPAYADTGIAGVANTGIDRNWCGHDFAQANWYAFGRLAWNPTATAESIADEWIRMTWSHEAAVVARIRDLMMGSRETFVRYTMPLGLHHLIGGDHYAVMPENDDKRRLDWSALYYHRASTDGIGFDRTKTGSDAVGQYAPPVAAKWGSLATVPDDLLLWFHRVPWDHKLASNRTVWDEMVRHYQQGAREAAAMEEAWRGLAGKVDAERHAAVAAKLRIQTTDAAAWRDKCLTFFQKFSQRPIAAETGR